MTSEYSHLLLTPKPDELWRFCFDLKRFNKCIETIGWPIPNILHVIHRIGDHRSNTYEIMDLTKAYNQAPLSAASRIFTAFITFMRVFE